ncbi:rho GDP dissociation inhibitor [Malassezia vespertilionis]|uniref:rho GDP dissociation inhibitor n=1 Tax=Malassezia vespertilionis TaxID=2020962 RepID=UPI0024B117EC|nr:rho GDP dissociation inhibitor [Malassezia vespertilionis]WFD07432.1 rho GDP dissociation inhibitor [Malassezia vespertilionis]
MTGSEPDDELNPTRVYEEHTYHAAISGYNPGQKKSLQEYANLHAEDESLRRWKESLGIVPGAAPADANAPKLTIHKLALESSVLPNGSLGIQLDRPGELERLSKEPLQVPEGIEYSVMIRFSVGSEVLSGLKYIHVVRRAGMPVDRMEEMIGSYPPRNEPCEKRFAPSEAPSGFLARSGINSVRSKVVDDDGTVYADFAWSFKLVKA